MKIIDILLNTVVSFSKEIGPFDFFVSFGMMVKNIIIKFKLTTITT